MANGDRVEIGILFDWKNTHFNRDYSVVVHSPNGSVEIVPPSIYSESARFANSFENNWNESSPNPDQADGEEELPEFYEPIEVDGVMRCPVPEGHGQESEPQIQYKKSCKRFVGKTVGL